jgi:hypothetical protein
MLHAGLQERCHDEHVGVSPGAVFILTVEPCRKE